MGSHDQPSPGLWLTGSTKPRKRASTRSGKLNWLSRRHEAVRLGLEPKLRGFAPSCETCLDLDILRVFAPSRELCLGRLTFFGG
jgi:hypothetical protein